MKQLEENFRMPTMHKILVLSFDTTIYHFLFFLKLFLKLTTYPFGRHTGAPCEGGPGHSQSKRSRPGGPASGRTPASGGRPRTAPHLPQGHHEENQRAAAAGAERQESGGHDAVRTRPSAAAWP